MDTRTKGLSSFDTIYGNAISGNVAMITAAFKEHICIDVRDDRGIFTPAGKLASEGQTDAVNFLINNFDVNKDFVAMGYASCGLREQAEKMRKEGCISIKQLAIGAAMHKDNSYAEWLRKKYNLNPEWLVYGASLSGNVAYANFLLSTVGKPKSNSNNAKLHEAATCMMIKGLIIGGHTAEAVKILDANKKSRSDLYLRVAIEALGRVADKRNLSSPEEAAKLVDGDSPIILRNGESAFRLEHYFELAAIGAAKGGHLDYAKCLYAKSNQRLEQQKRVILAGMEHGHFTETLAKFPHPKDLKLETFLSHELTMEAALRGNHRDFIQKALDAYSKLKDEMICNLAQQGNLSLAEDIAKKHTPYMSLSQAVTTNSQVVKAMDLGDFFHSEELLLYALTFLGDEQFILSLADAAADIASKHHLASESGDLQSAFTNTFFDDFATLAKKAIRLSKCMQHLGINYDQAKAMMGNKDIQLVMKVFTFQDPYAMLPLKELTKIDDIRGVSKADYHPYRWAGKIMAHLSDLSEKDATDLINKYMSKIAQGALSSRLQKYFETNTYLFAPLRRHDGRIGDLESKTQEEGDRIDKFGIFKIAYGINNGTVTPKPNKDGVPHYQQKPSSTSDTDFKKAVDDIYHSRTLNK